MEIVMVRIGKIIAICLPLLGISLIFINADFFEDLDQDTKLERLSLLEGPQKSSEKTIYQKSYLKCIDSSGDIIKRTNKVIKLIDKPESFKRILKLSVDKSAGSHAKPRFDLDGVDREPGEADFVNHYVTYSEVSGKCKDKKTGKVYKNYEKWTIKTVQHIKYYDDKPRKVDYYHRDFAYNIPIYIEDRTPQFINARLEKYIKKFNDIPCARKKHKQQQKFEYLLCEIDIEPIANSEIIYDAPFDL